MPTEPAPARTDARHLFELLAVFVVSMSGLGLLLARLGLFDAPPVWIGAILATLWYWHGTARRPAAGPPVPALHLILIVLVGLLFRLTPDAYVLGGQDQGIYLNSAMELARTGQLAPVDRVMANITDPAALEAYRRTNYTPDYLPGVYADRSGLLFQFYHLFQVWLALFGDGFGAGVAVYALTFLSLVSLLFFYRLAQLLTGSTTAGLVAGLLLALNPLHAFFSKFPVTEVPTLSLSLMAFGLLLTYCRQMEAGERRPGLLALSVAAMAGLFLTRISGFMYVPFICAVVLGALIFDDHRQRRRDIALWGAAVLVAYLLSVGYGLAWSNRYSQDIYRLSFAPVLGERWRELLGILTGVGLTAVVVAAWSSSRPAFAATMKRLTAALMRMLPFIGIAIAAFGAYRAYRLGYTDAYAADPWAGQRFGLSNQGFRAVFSTSLVASSTYLSPFLFLAYFPASFLVRQRPLLAFLLLFTTIFFAVVVVLQPVLAYQPYFARYLLSEFVPYALLLVVCAWGVTGGAWRKILSTALCGGAIVCAGLSLMQVGKSEHDGVSESLSKLVERFDRGDLVLIDAAMRAPAAHELKTALVFTMGLNVATVSPADLGDSDYLRALGDPYDDVYLLTNGDGGRRGFTEVDSVRFVERAFRHGALPPVALVTRNDSRIHILKQDAAAVDARRMRVAFGHGRDGNSMLTAGWNTPEAWGVWSGAKSSVIDIDLPPSMRAGGGDATLVMTGRAFVSTRAPTQRIVISIGHNQIATAAVNHPQSRLEIRAPVPAAELQKGKVRLEISLPDAVSPRNLGLSSDSRILALGLEGLQLVLSDNALPAGGPHN